jgi:hypothetical protein
MKSNAKIEEIDVEKEKRRLDEQVDDRTEGDD